LGKKGATNVQEAGRERVGNKIAVVVVVD